MLGGDVRLKKAIKIVLWLFLLNLIFIVSLTFVTGTIKKDMIVKNIEKSTVYFNSKPINEYLVNGKKYSVIHNYADIILMNISYTAKSEKPLKSAINADIYANINNFGVEGDLRKDLNTVVFNDGEKNAKFAYSRYWHGTLLFIRVFLTFTDFLGIRLINIITMLILTLGVIASMVYKKLYSVLFAYILANIMCATFIVPLTIEYCSVFFLMNLASIIIILFSEKIKQSYFFITLGCLTCFFDFLTTEIITLFIPLSLLLIVKGITNIKEGFITTTKLSLFWSLGYVFSWIFKWALAVMSEGQYAFNLIVSQGLYRVTGKSDYWNSLPYFKQLKTAISDNMSNIIPFTYIEAGVFFMFFTAFILFCIWFLYRKEIHKIPVQIVLFAVALIPYLRYVVLSNHAYGHSFFTFRAQFITIFCLTYGFITSLDFDLIKKKVKKWRK